MKSVGFYFPFCWQISMKDFVHIFSMFDYFRINCTDILEKLVKL